MKSKILFCLLILMITGCGPFYPVRRERLKDIRPETLLTPTNFSTAIRTLVPAEKNGSPAATAYPVASQARTTESGYPYPAAQALPGTTIGTLPAQASPVPFQDCARTPGLVGCAAQNVPVQARLAFFDSDANRLVGLDLETGQGWQAPLGADASPGWLSLSEDGQLLVALGSDRYAVFSNDGRLLESFSSETAPAWQPGGVLSRDGTLRSEEGAYARLEQDQNMQWLLRVRMPQGEQKTIPLIANPGDNLFLLRDWVPGGAALLAQSYFAGNQAMTQGGQVITIDVNDGAIQNWRASMPLNDIPRRNFAWDPAQPGLLAFLETSETSVLAPQLALLDLNTGELRFPLPEGLPVNGLAWNPDGRLAFSVEPGESPTPPEAQNGLPGPGIHLFDPQTGKVKALVVTPQGATDTWPQWSPDGQTLVYARVLPGTGGGLLAQVRARRLSDGVEWVLVEGLPGPVQMVEPELIQRMLAFRHK